MFYMLLNHVLNSKHQITKGYIFLTCTYKKVLAGGFRLPNGDNLLFLPLNRVLNFKLLT
jgi:hypothetical protein